MGEGEGIVLGEGGEVGRGGGFILDDVVGVIDGEAAAGFEEGDEKGGGFRNAESQSEGIGLDREVAAESGIGAGDDDDIVLEFFENFAEVLVEGGRFFRSEGPGVGEEEEDGRGFVDGVLDEVRVEIGEDGDVEDGLGAGGVVIKDDDGFFGFDKEVVDLGNEVLGEFGGKV